MSIQFSKFGGLALVVVAGWGISITGSPLSAQEEDRAGRRGAEQRDGGDSPREDGSRPPAESDRFRGPGRPGGFGGGPGGFGGPGGMAGPEMMLRLPVIAALDADKDGVLSEQEIDNATAALRKLDTNKDGTIDTREMSPFRGRPDGAPGDRAPGDGAPGDRAPGDRAPGDRAPGDRAPGDRAPGAFGDGAAMLERVMQQDKDGDGALSGDEIPERMAQMVDRADRDGDGKLSREELKRALEAMSTMMRRGDRGGQASQRGGQRGDGDTPGGEQPRRPPTPE